MWLMALWWGLGTAEAGGTASLSYGPAIELNERAEVAGAASVMSWRGNVYVDSAPIGWGMAARAHGGPQGFDLTLTPELCVGHLGRDVAAQLCGGLSIYGISRRDGVTRKGPLAPSLEPSLAVRAGEGAVFLSVPMGLDYRPGAAPGGFVGLAIGFGAFGD